MNIVVGCPIYKREWIISQWVDAVKRELADHKVTYVFVWDRQDKEFPATAWEVCDGHSLWLLEAPPGGVDKGHVWQKEDFFRMVGLRNQLLRSVRKIEPDLFFSLDSDMLLREGSFQPMLEAIEQGYDAVGVSTSMVRDRWCESWMYYSDTAKMYLRANEPADFEGVKKVDGIMGGKLMTPRAYNLDYVFHPQGEDLGWCNEARAEGLKLGIAAGGKVRHVMHPDDL